MEALKAWSSVLKNLHKSLLLTEIGDPRCMLKMK